MSRILVTVVALGLVLGGSVAAQPVPYPPPGYPPPAPYPVPPPGPYVASDGLTYLNGVPVYYAYGSYFPLVFVAGFGWGYYGPGHRWFGAPGDLRGRLDHFYPGGRGFAAGGHGRPGFHGPERRDERH